MLFTAPTQPNFCISCIYLLEQWKNNIAASLIAKHLCVINVQRPVTGSQCTYTAVLTLRNGCFYDCLFKASKGRKALYILELNCSPGLLVIAAS